MRSEDDRRRRDGHALQLHRGRGARRATGGREINPLVNPGAITATSSSGLDARGDWKDLVAFYWSSRRPLSVTKRLQVGVRYEPAQSGDRLPHVRVRKDSADPMRATDIYTEQCSVSVNVKDLRRWRRRSPTEEESAHRPNGHEIRERFGVLAVMATGRLYETPGSGSTAPGCRQEWRGGRHHRRVAGEIRNRRRLPAARQCREHGPRQKAIATISNSLGGNPYTVKPR
jgi:glutaminase